MIVFNCTYYSNALYVVHLLLVVFWLPKQSPNSLEHPQNCKSIEIPENDLSRLLIYQGVYTCT